MDLEIQDYFVDVFGAQETFKSFLKKIKSFKILEYKRIYLQDLILSLPAKNK